MTLTKEQRRIYLDQGGVHCPFCETADIAAEQPEMDGPIGFQSVSCRECGKEWTDVLTLTNVEDTE